MLLVDNMANTKSCKNPEKRLKPWHMGTHLRVLSKSYPWVLVLCTKEASAVRGFIVAKIACTTVACLPPIRGLEKCRVIGLVAWPAPFSQSQASKSVFLFPEEHG